jgi:hypothetical protein
MPTNFLATWRICPLQTHIRKFAIAEHHELMAGTSAWHPFDNTLPRSVILIGHREPTVGTITPML